MKFGVSLIDLYSYRVAPSAYCTIARSAEALGYESLWMGDHLLMPTVLPSTYPYTPNSRPLHTPGMHRLDAFIAFAAMAAVTQRVRFGTSVYLLPLRNPFVTARTITTLDHFSGGRISLGIGVGWMREEFAIVGEDFDNRGARTDEIIDILRLLWTREVVDFRGKHYSFGQVKFEPKPVQQPHPPILVGGLSQAALKRAARLGDGWLSAPDPKTGEHHSFEEMSRGIL